MLLTSITWNAPTTKQRTEKLLCYLIMSPSMIGILLHFKPLIRILSISWNPKTFGLTLQARVVLSGQSWAPGAKAANWVATAFGSGKAARGSAVYRVFVFFFWVVVSNNILLSPLFGEMIQFDENIFFQGGWNHLLVFFAGGGGAEIMRTVFPYVRRTQFQSGHLVRCAILIVYIVNWLRYSYFIFKNILCINIS